MKGYNKTVKDSLVSMHRSISDKDGDRISNAVDCEPNNPDKQGVLNWIKSKVTKQDYGELQAQSEERRSERKEKRSQREDERYQRQTQRLERRTNLEKQRQEISNIRTQRQKERIGLQTEQVKLQSQRQKLMPRQQMPSMLGGFGGFSSPGQSQPMPKIDPWNPLGVGVAPVQSVPVKKRKVKRTKKRSSKRKSRR